MMAPKVAKMILLASIARIPGVMLPPKSSRTSFSLEKPMKNQHFLNLEIHMFCASWTSFWSIWGVFWDHPEVFWSHLGSSWSHFGPSGGHLGLSWGHLELSWGHLELSWGGIIWNLIGLPKRPFNQISGHMLLLTTYACDEKR